jgi:hypothetical protein
MPFQFEPYDNSRTVGTIAELMLRGPHAQARGGARGRRRRAPVRPRCKGTEYVAPDRGHARRSDRAPPAQIAQLYGPEAQALRAQREAMASDRAR